MITSSFSCLVIMALKEFNPIYINILNYFRFGFFSYTHKCIHTQTIYITYIITLFNNVSYFELF